MLYLCYNPLLDDPSKLSPTVQTLLALFRELCGLMWFFHVRDQASLYLRKLQPKIHKVQEFILSLSLMN